MEQKTYPLEQHGLSIKHVDLDALYVMERLRAAGFVAYLVGGSVRDLLLNQKPKDFDISTSAEPEEIKKIFRNCILIGRRFRLAHIRFGKKTLEVSTFRSGATESDALILRDNVWGTPEEDAMRRDFTINGLFYDSATQTIIDYVGGYPDLQKKLLRSIGQPYIRFRQDPVRMLRLLKFQARFGLDVDPASQIALLECRAEIVKSSPARVLEELLRMLESGASEPFFRLLTDHGLLHLLTPAFGEFMQSSDGPEVLSFLKEIDTTFRESSQPKLDRSILLACLIFPQLEKRIATRFVQREKIPHLGEIHNEVHEQINEAFRPFLQLPRRIRISLASILTSQYRLTPLDKKKRQRIRIPNDPDFGHALKFFEVRTCLEPALQQSWQEWSSAYIEPPESPSNPKEEGDDVLLQNTNMHNPESVKTIDLYSDVSLSYIGPDLHEGPLPALFYFALSSHESLAVDPYNQPAIYLSHLPMRIFSLNIPHHGIHLVSQDALLSWAEDYRQGKNTLSEYVEYAASIIADLTLKECVLKEKCTVAGLSRGVLIATHVAARCAYARWILGFAPLTKIAFSKEFEDLQDNPLVQLMQMENLTSSLLDRKLRFYIGNCDQRVGTRNCFDFIDKLSSEMFASGLRSPPVELLIRPSVGFQGHGTSKESFHHGAQWIAEQLGVIDVQ